MAASRLLSGALAAHARAARFEPRGQAFAVVALEHQQAGVLGAAAAERALEFAEQCGAPIGGHFAHRGDGAAAAAPFVAEHHFPQRFRGCRLPLARCGLGGRIAARARDSQFREQVLEGILAAHGRMIGTGIISRMFVVTGGAGFLGSNLLAALEPRGEIVACDRLGADERWRNLAKRALADLLRPEELFAFLEGARGRVEAVFHMGAISTTTERDVDAIVANNVRLTLDLVDWCARREVRLIYASSAATYGDGAAGFDDDPAPAALARLRPLNAYGWSKHVVDRRIAALRTTGGALPPQCAGLKFFNVYGPNEYHKGAQRSVAHQIFEAARAGGPARLFRSHRADVPDGGQSRDFVWVDDCVAVMEWLLDHPGVGGLFNVGSGRARSFLDLARAVFSAMGKDFQVAWSDTPAALRDRYQYFTEAKLARLRAAGYDRAATPLEEGVRRYVQDFLIQEDPYR
jgi:ADP-L-glycero-D-manno-heptose 6-epimerase